MTKEMIIYTILVVISVSIYYILVIRKCRLLKRKEEELVEQKQTSKRLIDIFYKILEK